MQTENNPWGRGKSLLDTVTDVSWACLLCQKENILSFWAYSCGPNFFIFCFQYWLLSCSKLWPDPISWYYTSVGLFKLYFNQHPSIRDAGSCSWLSGWYQNLAREADSLKSADGPGWFSPIRQFLVFSLIWFFFGVGEDQTLCSDLVTNGFHLKTESGWSINCPNFWWRDHYETQWKSVILFKITIKGSEKFLPKRIFGKFLGTTNKVNCNQNTSLIISVK